MNSTYGYDNADRLTNVANKKPGPTTFSSFTYTLDPVGNRKQMVDVAGGTHTYVYDLLYRLTGVTYPGSPTDNYGYDANGNRLSKTGGTGTTYTYDAADQMLTAGGVSYGYDANGNQTSRATDTFTYDHDDRLTQTVISGATSSSAYNGDGLRTSHTVSGQPTNYTWEVATGLPRVLQDGTNTYVYGLDLISATDGSGTQTYFSYDGLGSTTALTNASGGTVATYTYDAFGGIRSQTGSSPNYWQFTGEQRDTDSNLYYLRARYYDPLTGRFISQDPLRGSRRAPTTQNRYAYSTNNPVNRSDPTGLSSIPPIPGEKFPCPGPDPIPPGTQPPCPKHTPTPTPCPPEPTPEPPPTPCPGIKSSKCFLGCFAIECLGICAAEAGAGISLGCDKCTASCINDCVADCRNELPDPLEVGG